MFFRKGKKMLYSYRKFEGSISEGILLRSIRHRVKLIRFPTQWETSDENLRVVDVFYFEPIHSIKRTVIMLHGLGTRNVLYLTRFAQLMAFLGTAVFLPIIPYNFTRTPTGFESGMAFIEPDPKGLLERWQHAVLDIRNVLDVVEKKELIDNITLMGYSLGGMLATLVSAFDERVKKLILIATGGNPHRIFWESPVGRYFRERVSKGGKICFRDKDSCYRALENIPAFSSLEELLNSNTPPCVKFDPTRFAPFVKVEKIIFFQAAFDHVIPKESAESLWKALGKPRRKILAGGHVTALATRTLMVLRILRFLKN